MTKIHNIIQIQTNFARKLEQIQTNFAWISEQIQTNFAKIPTKSKPTLLFLHAPINFIDIINCISLYLLFLTICQCFVTHCLNNLTICPFV